MKKAAGYLLLLALGFTMGCASSPPSTKQNLENAMRLSPGMSKDEVLGIMGNPIRTEFSKTVEEWHYCKTSQCRCVSWPACGPCNATDQFVALYFNNKALVASKNYTVNSAEVDDARGSCELFIKRGNYHEPETVTEIRMRIH